MFRRFYTHPMAFGFAVLATLVLSLALDHLAGNGAGREMLLRSGHELSQQVVVIGQRVIQQVVVIGHRAR